MLVIMIIILYVLLLLLFVVVNDKNYYIQLLHGACTVDCLLAGKLRNLQIKCVKFM